MPMLEAGAGVHLHLEDTGSGPPLVLVHGWSLSSRILLDAVAPLARGRRVVALDLRGHGGSTSAGPFTLDDLAGDLAALLESLRLDGATVLGWSLGAQVALAALPRVRRRVASLVLVAATPRFTEGDGWAHGVRARTVAALARSLARDPAGTVERFFRGMFAEGELDPAARDRAEAVRRATPLPDPATLRAGLDVLATADLRAALPAVDVPVLLVHGERDPTCPVAASRAAAERLPRARLALLPDAGHAPFLSRPAAFAALLAGALEARP